MNRMENRRRRFILLALVLAGVATFIPGITLPMMTVKKLVLMKNTFTVLSGIGALLADKTFGLGLLLLGFSVIFPLGKFALMAAYLYYYPPIPAALARWQTWLGKLAKFSMLDADDPETGLAGGGATPQRHLLVLRRGHPLARRRYCH